MKLYEIRAEYDENTITVYQAYSPEIAIPAIEAQKFVPPFSFTRMTWVKPSFLWMMYRCGWATKPNQERVLAITISRENWEKALNEAVLSSFDPHVYPDAKYWQAEMARSDVRVQWDPEKDLHLQRLPYKSVQVGIGGEIAKAYAKDWILGIKDITNPAKEIHKMIQAGDLKGARAAMPEERVYPTPEYIQLRLGMNRG